ncbi:MAG: TolC family protein [Bryobacterales bacterium]|nr:TolC family protein [Bryobacterales bacterium]
MKIWKTSIAVASAVLMLRPGPASAQPANWVSGLAQPYRFHQEAPIQTGNSGRLEALLRGGNLYLSLQDAIALALENNLDIAIQRYGPRLAEADLLRAEAGGAGVPNYDPTVSYNLNWAHNTSPQTSSFITGTSALVMTSTQSNMSISRGFATGTNVTFGWNNNLSKSSSVLAEFNPSISSNLNLQVRQSLLQGFGTELNRRNIRVARNSQKVSDLAFRQQVIATVGSVIGLYWDLVSYNEDVKVKRQAVALATQLLEENKRKVEIGTLAPIEVVRAEAQLASSQQELVVSETRVLQQETVLKNVLSRTGVASPSVTDARIIATDPINIPENEPIEPIQDLVARALANRPELAQTALQVENSKISLEGVKSGLRPTLDAVATMQNNGLAGTASPVPSSSPFQMFSRIDPYFIGGYGTALGQMFRRNFPNYSAGIQLTVPLGNRAAQAQMVSTQLTLRQQELRQQQQLNQVRLDVTNAVIGLQQTRAAYQAAVKARVLQEETYAAEQRRNELGASTSFLVIQAQRDLAAAQFAEVASRSNYAKARVALEQATGRLLAAYQVEIDEAVSGRVARAPSPLPPGME